MSKYTQFVESAKSDLEKLRAELDELVRQLEADCQHSAPDACHQERIIALEEARNVIQQKVEQIATANCFESDPSYQSAKSDAEGQYQALKAAVAAYRKEIERNAVEP